jgi:hypothetical protein
LARSVPLKRVGKSSGANKALDPERDSENRSDMTETRDEFAVMTAPANA